MNDNEKQYEDFISTVSHELRTPLTSIRGFAQTMLMSFDKLDDESKKKFLKIIEEQSNRLIKLVENMLSVTKISGCESSFIFKETEVEPLINTVVSVVKSQYPTKKFRVEKTPQTPTISVDRDKFQQVMTNLIENGAKYSNEGTEILIKISSCDNCDFVSIQVIDEGVEISEKDYEKIFEKFTRIDNPLTSKVQGSGLGLYITKCLVEKMQGQIRVSSGGGKTMFEIKFPVFNAEQQAREKCKQ